MKTIKKISLHNFLSWQELNLPIEQPVLLIAGDNGAGKSSIKDAIEFAFTARCPNRGIVRAKDHPKLRNIHSRPKSEVSVALEYDEDNITRRKTRSLSNGLGDIDENPLIPYCLNPMRFIDAKPSDRAAILATVYAPSEQLIEQALAKYMPKMSEPIKSHLTESGIDPNDLDALQATVVAYRREVKRECKWFDDVKYPVLTDYDLAENYEQRVKAETETLRIYDNEIKTLDKNRYKAGQYDTAKARVIGLHDQIGRLVKELPDLSDRVESKVNQHEVALTSEAIALLREQLPSGTGGNGPTNESGICPICSQQIWLNLVVEHLEKKLTDMQQTDTAFRAHKAAEAQDVKTRTRIAEVHDQHRQAQELLDTIAPIGAADLLATENDYDRLCQQRDELKERLKQYRDYKQASSIYEEQEAMASSAEKLIDECNAIDRALADGGPVRSEILRQSEELPFNSNLLKGWGIGSFDLFTNGDLVVDDVPAEMLSDSEKYRVAAVVALALAEIGDVGFACLDGFELLMPHHQNTLLKTLKDRIEIPLLIISVSSVKAYDKLPDWIQLYQIPNGQGMS